MVTTGGGQEEVEASKVDLRIQEIIGEVAPTDDDDAAQFLDPPDTDSVPLPVTSGTQPPPPVMHLQTHQLLKVHFACSCWRSTV